MEKTTEKTTKTTTLNIYQKMARITADLQTVGKNLMVGVGKSAYKAVSERDIIDTVKPLEDKYGIYSYPAYREVLESNMLENESTYNGATTTKTTFMTRIKTVYRFVNVDNPEEYIDTITFAEGIDSQDKGSGKAMTYADKYALMKAYKISTGDDPDQQASEPTAYKKAQNKQSTPREQLIKLLHDKNININEYAKEKGLTAQTTSDEYLKLIKELEG